MELTLLSLFSDWALLGLRIILAIVFLAHGWPKLMDLKKTAAGFSSIGFKPGIFWGTLAGLLEVFGGLAILAGFWTELIAIPFIGEFIVIILWKLKTKQKLVGNLEIDLLVFGGLLILFTLGAGSFSISQIVFGGF